MSTNGSAIADETYVSLTSFKRDGEPRATPVWIVDLGDGTVGFTTASSSYKVKRIKNNSRVELQPSDARGNPKPESSTFTGHAEVLTGSEYTAVRAKVKKKYGLQYAGIELFGKVAKLLGKGSGTDTAIRITLD